MAEYDLTIKIGGYLDRHLVLPLLEFLSERKVFDESDVLKARLALLTQTNMVDYALEVHNQVYPDNQDPDHLVAQRDPVLSKFEEFKLVIDPILDLITDSEVSEHMENNKDQNLLDYLVQNHEFKVHMVDVILDCAKFQFECGKYNDAKEYLYFYRLLAPADHKTLMSAQWGKLSCSILCQDWEVAMEDLNTLRRKIDDTPNVPHLTRLQQRTWLIHWSLFVYFNHPKGQDEIINLFLFTQDYLNAIQTCCPHIFRYLTAAVITNKKRQTQLKDLVRIIKHESYAYRDPVTEFVECLYVKFDFDLAQQKLVECEKVLENDFFLVACKADFIENARMSIFETFCRIHHCISISMLAEKLNMSSEHAERWIVNLIRNAKLDAKIDALEGHVVMNTQATSLYQRVIDKTKSLAFSSQFVAQNIDKKRAAGTVPSAGEAPVPPQTRWAPMN